MLGADSCSASLALQGRHVPACSATRILRTSGPQRPMSLQDSCPVVILQLGSKPVGVEAYPQHICLPQWHARVYVYTRHPECQARVYIGVPPLETMQPTGI